MIKRIAFVLTLVLLTLSVGTLATKDVVKLKNGSRNSVRII